MHIRILTFWFVLLILPGNVYAELFGNPDSLEVRPSLTQPRLSLPSKLTTVPVASPGEFFVPPLVEDIPDDKYGDMVKLGRNIFIDTQIYASRYVGNGLNCSNCHLQEGRKPYAAPLWGAFGMYLMFRNKNRTVVSFEQRMQDCFKYSLDGIAPTVDSPEMQALVSYAHWLSRGAPVGVELPGRGFTTIKKKHDPSPQRGEIVYQTKCAICHGADGTGKKHKNAPGYIFPPLWGWDSFNKAAGMNRVRTAARYIKANMPLGGGYTLTDQEAFDVAIYMRIQTRPWDPRMGWFFNFFFPKVQR